MYGTGIRVWEDGLCCNAEVAAGFQGATEQVADILAQLPQPGPCWTLQL